MNREKFFFIRIALFMLVSVCAVNILPAQEIVIDCQNPNEEQNLLGDETRTLSIEDELDLQNFFGDPEDRGGSEELRIRSAEISQFKMFFFQWGVWAAVRCDDVWSYMKAWKKAVRKRFFAYMGWKYGRKGCSREA